MRAGAEEALRSQMKLAGTTSEKFVNTKDYNFILGMAEYHDPRLDLADRVLADNPSEGTAIRPAAGAVCQPADRQFDRAGLPQQRSDDLPGGADAPGCQGRARAPVRPANHAGKPGGLAGSDQQGKGQRCTIYINRGDPVPGGSYLGTQKERVLNGAELHAEFNDSLGNEINKYAPGVKVQFNDCPPELLNTGPHRTIAGNAVSLNCHDMKLYQKNVDSQTR